MPTPGLTLPSLPAKALEDLLDRTDAWIYTVNGRDQILSVNRGMVNRVDFDPEQLPDLKAMSRLLYAEPSARETMLALHRKALAGDSAPEAEWMVSTRSGEERQIRWQFLLVGQPKSPDRVLVVIGDDVTEKRKLEQWVRVQNTLLERVPEAIIVADLEGRILHWTGAATTLLGYSATSALQRPLSNLFPDEFARLLMQDWIQTLRVDGEAVFLHGLRRENGEIIECRIHGARVPNERGLAIGVAFVCAPASSADLPRNEQIERVLSQVGSVAAVVTDADGVVQSWNRAAERLGGMGSNKAVGKKLFDAVMFTPTQPWSAVQDKLDGRGRHQGQVKIARPNGTEAIADVDGVALREGKILSGGLFFFVDRSDAQLTAGENLRTKTRAAYAMLGEGLSRRVLDAVSWFQPDHRFVLAHLHDVRALARLVAAGATMREFDVATRRTRLGSLDNALDDVMYRLGEGVQRLSSLADDVAIIERSEPDAPGPIRIGRELEAARELLAHHFSGDVTLDLMLDDLPAASAARGPLLRGLALLLIAAVESCRDSAAPRVTVEGKLHAGWVQVEIRDSGAGYAVDVQSHLNDKAWLAQQPGLAPLLLGLARESLRLAGGNLELETASGVGSRVRVSFPVAEAVVALQTTEVYRRPGPLRGRVLLIEEDELLRRALHRFLGEQHDVHAYGSIAETLTKLGDAQYDAAVISFPRPEGAGLRLLERFAAAAPSLHRNSVVVVPPGIRHATRERLVSQGSVVVPRPVDFTLLRSVLLRMMPLTDLVGDPLDVVEALESVDADPV